MRRIRTAVGLLLLLTLGITGCTPSGAPDGLIVAHEVDPANMEQPAPSQPPVPDSPAAVRLAFVGDIMLTRTPGEAMLAGADPFGGVARVLTAADLTVGNLECVVATKGEKVPKAYNFRCSPQSVPYLKRYMGAVTLANNHSGDYGKEAFAEQLDLLAAGGVPYFGGGRNLTEAHTPLILEKNGLRVALLGYDEIELRSYEAGPTTPGVAWSDDDRVVADIAAARKVADVVVVSPHWGLEYHFTPSERQQSLARKMIDAGADLVVGTHPHVVQTAEYYKDRLIVYSLGNFVFDDYKDVSEALNEPSRTSWILRVEWDKDGLHSWDTVTARTDDRGFPQILPERESPCGRRGTALVLPLCQPEGF